MATAQVTKSYIGRATLVVKANGGSVTVEKMVEGGWVVVDTFAADGAWQMDFGQSTTRITPYAGAAFEVLQ
ncbi:MULTISPECIES: hypothetical protein [unclassified Pseudomonas]|uniref:hypothetical protein n=1 Tax=unclassified Pseudomonas TaxID=196821 RepID=UPI000BDA00FE|nr:MULTISPECIES: hypothetical protein [unclassified Pseudomonas]PVZ19905.1 hypothetical protein F474_00496 [Pseudomonas sp. URIL14HWK12:I12]PVZ26971.1 hypothetical protein F470_00151 [Pseudomonas sp. URIL14HWK12:I10]PVZ37860.1 hypothetical protein F472_00496 [Pseudomonas sp. URIL14HWK12:I11]SNZ05378.1 hypothetical protein SAMN05660463_00908 [Pseudomonas sp. URIL14HWK12:I9]